MDIKAFDLCGRKPARVWPCLGPLRVPSCPGRRALAGLRELGGENGRKKCCEPDQASRRLSGITMRPSREKPNADASASRLGGRVPLISFWIPEWPFQTNPCKNLYHLVWTRPARLHGQAILIPGHREIPKLVEIDTRPLGKPTSLTPLSHCLFRPEEQHGRSGVKDVIPPMCRWHRKMDDT